MIKHLLIFLTSFSLASFILIISIFNAAKVNYVFSQSPSPTPSSTTKDTGINYNLAYPGKILSDNLLWPIKALRDRVELTVTINPSKKADLLLLLADKRLGDAKLLFEKEKPDLGLSVATKAEKYLENAEREERIAKKEGMDTTDFLKRFSLASLKHQEVLDEIMTLAPEDAKPLIVKVKDYPIRLYNESKTSLLEAGANVPVNPFN